MRVLAVGAHPDDLEILCGGTLARFVLEGHEVVMCHATRGDRGSFVHSSEEIALIRGAEARRAAEICGAEYATLGFSDAEINAADRDQQDAVVDVIRDARPDLIEPVWEYHHSIGKSITGGVVYRGKKVPELEGCYLYGDFVSGKLWALKYDDKAKKVAANYILQGDNLPVMTYGEDEQGEAYFTTPFGQIFTFAKGE